MFGHHQYPANFLDSDIGLLIIYLQLQANLRNSYWKWSGQTL